jgi:signal peptidase I
MNCTKCGSKRIKEKKGQYICKDCGEVLELTQSENGDLLYPDGTLALKKRSVLRETLDFCLPIVLALIIALLLKSFVFANAVIPTGSMLNTIQKNDRVIASRIAYTFNDPERYDIIIFKYPDDETQYFVKRVIGLPGETVNITDGIVYVTRTDGTTIQLEDDFVTACVPTGTYGPYEVPEDSYFVMGDNRNDSVDSRFWTTSHYVEKEKIIGKVMFRYYPSIGKIE